MAQQVPFPSNIDPSGILAGLTSNLNNFIHSEQNEVKYYNRTVGKGGAIK